MLFVSVILGRRECLDGVRIEGLWIVITCPNSEAEATSLLGGFAKPVVLYIPMSVS